MAYYSLVVWTPTEITIRNRVLLDPGVNTFNIEISDIDALTASLTECGARVVQCHRLDQFDSVPAEPEMLLVAAMTPPQFAFNIGQVVNVHTGLAGDDTSDPG